MGGSTFLHDGFTTGARLLSITVLPRLIPCGLVILACLVWLTYRLVFSSVSKIPGPWYTKLSGLFVIYHDLNGSKRLWILNLHRKYGKVVRLAPNEVSFASTTALRDIYTSAGGYEKTELYSLFQQSGHSNLFTAIDKKEHNEKKRRLADRYTNTAVLQADVQNTLRARADAFAQVCARNKTVDVYFYLHCYALDCVSAVVFEPYGTNSIQDKKDNEMVRKLSYHQSRIALVLRHHFSPRLERVYRMMSGHKPKGGAMIVDYAWSSMRKERHADFTLASRMLEYPEIGMGNMVAECLDHIGAGIDTTGDSLCFLMWELSQPRNADRMRRLTAELLACDDPAKGGRLETLPYLNAVIDETMRLWAPGTLPLPRYVPPGGRVIDGYYVPHRTIVSCQSYTLHRLDQDVFPQPDAFIPERWLEEEEKDMIERRRRLMFAFGAGARMCIGKFVALSEMRLLLYAVYSQFRTRPADDMHASMEMSDQFMISRPKDMLCKLTFEPLE